MIRVKNLQKSYQMGKESLTILHQATFTIRQGEFVAVVGPSGSGKSTLMHILGCLDRPTSGEYWFHDQDTSQLTGYELAQLRNRKIGFVFQNFHLLPRMTARQNVELPMMYAGMKRAERRKRAEDLLETLGLSERLHHLPNELSGGQKQRVAIARALANRPELLLADEPTGALDSTTSHEILEIFQELHQSGVTLLIITHDYRVAQYAKRHLFVEDGFVSERTWEDIHERN
ncbi:ABC transporter ATP-binding protein [Alicyclobacillus tolerans]|uniref:ABC transport system ATP-binding protein n=2 Tax=Alicyclobacillus tolerans TaxID=90970 RepID=A0ABT9LXL9_9BACL|nr:MULTISPECIES: ABC transporter ATP-binding protein [Alicyclobacillus]MDP9729011.1 putative ABC transport system ATP-binding protein [Alicyclobacillus tengchongensis]SHK78241.1 putative ABC transport system ATP-binding protein [Alicyclobacillus montanus]